MFFKKKKKDINDYVFTPEELQAKRESHARFMYLPEDRLKFCILRDKGLIQEEPDESEEDSGGASNALNNGGQATKSAKQPPRKILGFDKMQLVIVGVIISLLGVFFGVLVESRRERLATMDAYELWVYASAKAFEKPSCPEVKGVILQGEDKESRYERVLVSSADNIKIEFRNDSKNFVTVKLLGNVMHVSDAYMVADGAVFLIPPSEKDYSENLNLEFKNFKSDDTNKNEKSQ